MANKLDYVELALTCVGVCNTLHQRRHEGQMNELSRPVYEAIEKLKT